jgi:RNA polymerase sigma-70 factor (ECF subfamily)
MTWTLTMARNAVIDQLRRARPQAVDVDELADQLAGPHTGPLNRLVRDEELQAISRHLARQPADIREMFALRFEQGLRVREVAEVMGLSPDAAKQRFARTIRKLQLQLRDEDKGTGQSKGESPCAATD